MRARLVIVLLTLTMLSAVRAQQTTTAEPIVRTTIDPARVTVGQAATLRIDVLAPNYMTSPPEIPNFQLRNAVTRQLQSVNINEQQNGTGYAGVRFEFAIYPLEAGSYALAEQKLTVKYAAEPPATREAVVALPRLELQAFIPDAAAALQPFLSASKLTIEQTVQRSSEQLKTGDAVTRIVTVGAEGIPAMMLPPMTFPAIDGLAVYPAQPALQDKTDGRTDALSASRVDSATYMLEKPGNYTLPAIDVRWWNPAESKIETVHLDAVTLQVVPNPAAQAAVASSEGVSRSVESLLDVIAEHWRFGLIALVGLALVARFAPRLAQNIVRRRRQRREAWLRSEPYFFGRLRQAARRDDAKVAYFALLDWLQRFEPSAPSHTVGSLKAMARDPGLDRAISSIERELFASDHGNDVSSPRQLLREVSAARRNLGRRHTVGIGKASLPQELNPTKDQRVSPHGRRMPAR